jgi:hypothetical protein
MTMLMRAAQRLFLLVGICAFVRVPAAAGSGDTAVGRERILFAKDGHEIYVVDPDGSALTLSA